MTSTDDPGPGDTPVRTGPVRSRTEAAVQGRRADTTRRRERVHAALEQARISGTDVSVASLAQTAGVDRSFLYRHRDLLATLRAIQTQPDLPMTTRPTVSHASLQADLLAAHERAARLASHIQLLERRLSQALGEQAWRESGLGAPADIDELHQQITLLEQRAIDLKLQLAERDQDLEAARVANRELMTRINTAP